jgi:hypothetical protein
MHLKGRCVLKPGPYQTQPHLNRAGTNGVKQFAGQLHSAYDSGFEGMLRITQMKDMCRRHD